MSRVCRGLTPVVRAAIARVAAIGLLACVPEVVRWDQGTAADLSLPEGGRLVLDAGGTAVVLPPWAPPTAPASPAGCAGSLSAARARGDTAFAAWWAPRSDSNAFLVVARSNDGGHTWNAAVVADSTDRGRAGCRRTQPAITVDSLNGYVHVVYFLVAPEGSGVFCTHSMEGGAMFHAAVPIVYGERPSAAAIATRGDSVAVAYEDPNASVPQVWLAVSRTAGHIFEERTSVSSSSAHATRPSVALLGGRIAVAWHERERGGRADTTVLRTGTVHW